MKKIPVPFDVDRAYKWYESTPEPERTCILVGSVGLVNVLQSRNISKAASTFSSKMRAVLHDKPRKGHGTKEGRSKLAYNLRVSEGGKPIV